MRKISLFIPIACTVLLFCCAGTAHGQMTGAERGKLAQLAEQLRQADLAQQALTLEQAKLRQVPLEIRRNGEIFLLDHFAGDQPIYIGTDNMNAAATISANQVKTGGALNLNLSGAGQTLGLWEAGGIPRTTHQEFAGRLTVIDGTVTPTNHGTHVAGTMIAPGIDATAQGLAHNASLFCYNSASDDSEMATAAGAPTPIRISNHSYGPFAGWDLDGTWSWMGPAAATSDWQFGAYDAETRTWDNIAFTAPFYLIVKSAGNHRDDFGPGAGQPHFHGTGSVIFTDSHNIDGPFDCITTYSTAKNILTVGAVEQITGGYTQPADVVMSDFSSWGPTDDGRIKPDLVAPGVDLWSTGFDADDDYYFNSGTSMATPVVSGSASLMLEHWANTIGGVPRAATVKGLLIQQADECGANNGPDYSHGWGLINVADAAELVTIETYDGCQQLVEGTLNATDNFTLDLYSSGQFPLKVTLVWSDPPATAINSTSTVNPAGAVYLVNDLDLRLEHNGGNLLPFVLNPASPNAAAGNGVNTRDNVEQVLVLTPEAGVYTIRVTAPASIVSGPQAFTLWFSGNDADAADRTISGTTLNTTQTYAVRHDLTFGPAVSVVAPANVRAFAGHAVILKAGFTAQAGSRFHARIQPGGGCAEFSGALKSDNYAGGRPAEFAAVTRMAAPAGTANGAVDFNIAPNPAMDQATIAFTLPENDRVGLTVFNSTGQVVVQQAAAAYDAGDHLFRLDLQNLPEGGYLCQLQTGAGLLTKAFMVMR